MGLKDLAAALNAGQSAHLAQSVMAKDALQRLIETYQARLAADFHRRYNGGNCESPIEQIFLTALTVALDYPPRVDGLSRMLPTALGATGPVEGSPNDCLHIAQQVQIGPRRVDFVIWCHDGRKWRRLLVECDGHDYHERTKEQAAKDRSFDRYAQSKGDTIFRFTGSQINGGAEGCAYEVLRWADQINVGGPHGED